MKLLSIVIATLISKAVASSSEASACPAGDAAPEELHRSGLPGLVGALSKGNYVVKVGGETVAFDGTPVRASLDFDIAVTAEGAGFKGILIRVGGSTADQVISPDLTAPARACGNVGSVNHSDASLKRVATAIVSLDADVVLDVDISVVLETDVGRSTFYYSAFQINAVDGDLETTTSPPVAAPFVETINPTTVAPVLVVDAIDETVAPTTISPAMTTIIPSGGSSTDNSDRPSVAPFETPFVESNSPSSEEFESGYPSLDPAVPPASDTLTYTGTAAALFGAFMVLLFK